MIRAWRMWKSRTNLSSGKFLKYYIYDRLIIRPKRKLKKRRSYKGEFDN